VSSSQRRVGLRFSKLTIAASPSPHGGSLKVTCEQSATCSSEMYRAEDLKRPSNRQQPGRYVGYGARRLGMGLHENGEAFLVFSSE
jgi:hypothetical protein